MDITMDSGHLILAAITVVSGVVAVRLAMGRGRLKADTTAARAALESADADRVRLAAEVQGHTRRAADLDERHRALELQHTRLEGELDTASAQHRADLERAQEVYGAQLRALEQRERDLQARLAEFRKEATDTFKSLASDALKSSIADLVKFNQQALATQQARATGELEQRKAAVEQLVKPIGESLASLGARVHAITEAAGTLGRRTEQLREALSKPQVRGRYGEIQLQRVVEVAGMKNYCGDYASQDSVRDGDGRLLRPDMVVKLPNDRVIVIDSKANIGAYVEALDAQSVEEKEHCLDRFAGHVADQVGKLAAKSYWDQFDKAPEFVVMFIPGDQFIDAALQRRPELFELAAQKRVILASPSTLIGLLRAVELGWKEQRLAEEAVDLRRLGIELHERACVAFGHLAKLGESIETTVRRYNEFVGSYETRLEPTLKRFHESGVKSSKELPEVGAVEVRVRMLPNNAPTLIPGETAEGEA